MFFKALKVCASGMLVQRCFFLTITSFCFADNKNGVSPNTISLPEYPCSIEGLGKSFQSMLDTGSARYHLIIKFLGNLFKFKTETIFNRRSI
nr:hypothetical protein [uncultured Desulfobacter sp.]